MSENPAHRKEKLQQMAAQIDSLQGVIVAHFPPDHVARIQGQSLLHQLWAVLYLGYHSRPAEDPKSESQGTAKKEEPANPGTDASTEKSAETAPPKLESVQ